MKKINYLTILCLFGWFYLPAQNWQLNQYRSNLEFSDLQFLDSQTGFVFGDSLVSGVAITGVVLKTTDGGQSWNTFVLGNPNYVISKAHVLNTNELFAAGRNGGGNTGLFIKSDDGGVTWSNPASFGERLNNVYFTNASIGWVMGRNGLFSKTTDGGLTWTTQNVTGEDLNAMKFLDSNTGLLACGGGELYRTSDGGNSWQYVNSNVPDGLLSISVDGQQAWICGEAGTIIHSDDGGLSWALQTPTLPIDFNAVSFATNMDGWIAGLAGIMNMTTDGGLTWQAQSSGTTNEIIALEAPDINHGWFCTHEGEVYYFDNTTSLQESQVPENVISLFPNPVNETLHVNSSIENLQTWYIVNQNGSVVKSFKFHINSQRQIDVSGLAAGIYNIYAITRQGEKSVTRSFVKD